MPDEITLTIPGPPVPWAPKRTNMRTGNRFIPSRQEEATGRVIRIAQEAMERGLLPILAGDPIELSAVFYVKRPKGHYGTGRNAREIKERFVDARPTGKPDLSNNIKLVEDGLVLAGLLPDDDQIVGFYTPLGKFYTQLPEEQPRSVVRIRSAS